MLLFLGRTVAVFLVSLLMSRLVDDSSAHMCSSKQHLCAHLTSKKSTEQSWGQSVPRFSEEVEQEKHMWHRSTTA